MIKNKSRIKRLFLFAGYDAHGIIDKALIYYVRALSKLGDVIVCTDCDCAKSEIKKIEKYTIGTISGRHGEYDFGSYKRAYMYAHDARILPQYDYVYLINDSVYGPLEPLAQYLLKMESFGTDAFGMVCNPNRHEAYIQSWFIGCAKSVFLSKWFDEFMRSVTHQPDKGSVTYLYEHGFTRMLNKNNKTWQCIYSVPNRGIYNRIKKLYLRGLPFFKKNAFIRHNGALGAQIAYILRHIPDDLARAIMTNATRTWGDEHIHWLLTRNPIKIFIRNIKYATHKILHEGL